MFQTFLLITLLILGTYAVLSDNLRYSVVVLGAFSLTMALTYLNYNAPDVALAEAAIGVGLSTVMYLIALKKVTVYDICYINEDEENFNDDNIEEIKSSVSRPLELFIEKTEELEPQISYTNRSLNQMIDENIHDLIISRKEDSTFLYGRKSDRVFKDIVENIDEIIPDMTAVEIVYIDEVIADADPAEGNE
jgi:uncharacterized MnhB-related membrane protein